MGDIWLIYNPRSKSCDEGVIAEIERLFFTAGRPIQRKLMIGEDSLPDAKVAGMARVDMIVVLSGDGTINAVADSLKGWDGVLLILPGGTMNLLARALHGDASAVEIVQACLAGHGELLRVPTISDGKVTAYAGIIVGPSAAWADVREEMRDLNLVAMGANAIKAVTATFEAPGVTMKGAEGSFPAIYIEPGKDRLRAYGVKVDSAGELLSHGIAWLKGDFREGPSDTLPASREVTLSSEADSFDLLVDGEKAEAPNPVTFRLGQSAVRFFSARGSVAWT